MKTNKNIIDFFKQLNMYDEKTFNYINRNSKNSNLVDDYNSFNYSYNDLHFYKDANIPDHEKVVCKEHDPYVEAIVGAVYYDSNYDTTRRWILKWLLPLLEKYK